MVGLASFLFMLLFFALGVPVAFALLGVGIGVFTWQGLDLVAIPQRMVPACAQFTYLAVPFFFLAAELMNIGTITDRLFNFAQSVVGHIRGGLAHVNVLGSMIFAGMSGSALADAAGLGKIEITAMTKAGYKLDYATAVTISSATIGPIIPPSIPMIVLGAVADISVGQLFFGGAVPGVLMGLAFMVICYWQAIRHGHGTVAPFSLKNVWRDFKRAIFALITPAIILGGIILGIFTPTEAAAIACFYAFIVAGLIYRGLQWRRVFKSFIEVGVTTSATMIIIAAASIFGLITARENVVDPVFGILTSITTSPAVMMMIFTVLWIIVGCFMEAGAAMVIFVPILMPIVHKLGINPVHFGVLTVMLLMLGLLTPPFGLLLFLASSMTGVSVARLARVTLPFMVSIVAVVLLLIFVPSLVTFIPNLIFAK